MTTTGTQIYTYLVTARIISITTTAMAPLPMWRGNSVWPLVDGPAARAGSIAIGTGVWIFLALVIWNGISKKDRWCAATTKALALTAIPIISKAQRTSSIIRKRMAHLKTSVTTQE